MFAGFHFHFHISSFHAFLHSLLSLLADVLSLLPDAHTYEFESGGPTSSGQSMGRLRQSIGFWESIGASKTVLDWIRFGVPLKWKSAPVEPRVLRNSRSALEHSSFIDSAVSEMLESSVIRHSVERPVVVSPLGVVPKPNSKDKLRLIVNMRYVNQAIVVPKFKMETLSLGPLYTGQVCPR